MAGKYIYTEHDTKKLSLRAEINNIYIFDVHWVGGGGDWGLVTRLWWSNEGI